MHYVGIDIGKERHAVAAIGQEGQPVWPGRFFASDQSGYESMAGLLRELGPCDDVCVGLEATGHYGKLLSHRLRGDGWTVHVFNPVVTAAAAKGDLRGRKTDRIDAHLIAQILRDGKCGQTRAAPPDEEQLKALGRQRVMLVNHRTSSKNHLTALLDVLFPELATVFKTPYSATHLALVERFPSAASVAVADIRTLTSLLAKASCRQMGREDAMQLKKAARTSLACSRTSPGEEFAAQQTAAMIRVYNEQILRVERQMQACESPIARYLMSIKGAGKTQPFIIAGELGNFDRFQGRNMSRRVLAFAGCEPRIRESGTWRGTDRISKRGSPTLRRALFLMAHTIQLNSPPFAAIYERQIARGKAHVVALSHVVRAIINTLCGMHKTQTFYRPPEQRKTAP